MDKNCLSTSTNSYIVFAPTKINQDRIHISFYTGNPLKSKVPYFVINCKFVSILT